VNFRRAIIPDQPRFVKCQDGFDMVLVMAGTGWLAIYDGETKNGV